MVLQLVKISPGLAWFFYVDDGALLAISKSFMENAAALENAFEEFAQLLASIGFVIEPPKCEVMHFQFSRQPLSTLPIRAQLPDGKIHVVQPTTLLRWLGFFFDPKLLWRKHIEIMCNCARSKVQGLKVLGNSVKGLSHVQRRTLYKSVVPPVLTYGGPLWYSGSWQKGLVKDMERVQTKALRMMLGAFRTSPNVALHHMGAILPMQQYLEKLWCSAVARLRVLESTAQPVLRLPSCYGGGASTSEGASSLPVDGRTHPRGKRVERTQLEVLGSLSQVRSSQDEKVVPYAVAPWEKDLGFGPVQLSVSEYVPQDEDEQRQYITGVKSDFEAARDDNSQLLVYADGSRHDGYTGAGFVAYYGGNEAFAGQVSQTEYFFVFFLLSQYSYFFSFLFRIICILFLFLSFTCCDHTMPSCT